VGNLSQSIYPKILSILLMAAIILSPLGSATAWAASEISRLVLSKNALALEVGDSESLTATAIYVNGSDEDVTIKTDWTSGSESVASVYAGTITAKSEGTAVITATYMGKTVIVNVTVSKKVRSLTSNKQNISMRTGGVEEVALTAVYSDNSTEDVTNKAEWTTGNHQIATVLNGDITGKAPGETTITAKYGKQTVTIPVGVDVARRLDPEQPRISLRLNEEKALKLWAVFSDTTEDVSAKAEWTSDKPNVADVINGKIKGYGTGTALLTARYGTKTATVTVDVEVAKRLEVNKPNVFLHVGNTETLSLTAYFSEGAPDSTVASKASWSSSNPAVADVDNTGKITGYSVGQAVITASYGTKTVTVSVDVGTGRSLEANKYNVFLRKNASEQITLTAYFADQATGKDVTQEAEWTSSNEAVAYVSEGKITGYKPGEATVTAKYGDKTVTIHVDVETPRRLIATPEDLVLSIGETKTITLETMYANGEKGTVTDEAEWTSNNEEVAIVTNGRVTGLSSGSATITAKYGDKQATVLVDVDVPRRLVPSKTTLNLQDGGAEQITLKAVYADNTEKDVTSEADWISGNEEIVEVRDGFIQGHGTGSTTVTARYGKRSVPISVNVGVVTKLTAVEPKLALELGEEKQVVLTATFADNSTKDVTDEANWTSGQDSIATVNAGMVRGAGSGSTSITATYGNKSIAIPVEVDVAKSLDVNQRLVVMGMNEQRTLTLTATYSHGGTKNVTSLAEWSTNQPTVVDVNKGVLTANNNGRATVTAKYGGKTITVSVEVEVVQKLTLNKRFLMMKTGNREQLVLTATYSNGSTRNVSAEADWTTRMYKVADVQGGLVTAIGSGKTTITAKYGGKTVSIPVEVDTLKYLKTDVVKLEMRKGETVRVTLTATYFDGSEANVAVPALWASSKILVADAKDGIIKANGPGQAVITATFGGKRASIVVIVR